MPIFAYLTTADLWTGGLSGFADDNWRDGTQSFVYTFTSPQMLSFGYGFTPAIIHEVGHHLGMSHPHDGVDSERDLAYGPSDDTYFAWSGDESCSVMSYIDLNWDFSQFDRDNMARYLTSGYVNQANRILAQIVASPRADSVTAALLDAGAAAATALARYAGMDYAQAAAWAKAAYDGVAAAAAAIDVPVEPEAWPADERARARSSMFVDGVDGHRLGNAELIGEP